MDVAALAAKALLTLVFVVAGSSKLADPKGSRRALIDFGFPAALARPLGLLLPLAELAVAAALLPAATAPYGALGALALLLLFVVGIGLNLARGQKPDCHCFGRIHSAPAGPETLARNGALCAVAGFLVWRGWRGGPSAAGWAGDLPAVGLLGLAGALALVGLLAYRSNGRPAGGAASPGNGVSALLRSGSAGTCGEARVADGGDPRTGPAAGRIGAPAPKIELRDPSGEAVNLWSIQGEETLVLFLDPDCVFCRRMLPDLKRWEEGPPGAVPEMLVVCAGPDPLGLKSPVLFDRRHALFRGFGVGETPSAVLVDAEGSVASEAALGAPAILELARSRRPGRSVGGWLWNPLAGRLRVR